ncbi:hypothetical protein F0562_016921 [Nyssa sinensis]|uniref:Uncharacterized protein n=1 Tax=Nyssa sinensis TaxID=561372 RepID=A0A5J4ZD66_9ASTE|nr:hypothetical protein F0562_016921 [Nyssa sinensis]
MICSLFATIGSRWSIIAAQLPGRTDNDIKNYWNTKLRKKLMGMISSSQKRPHQASIYPSMSLLQTSPLSYSALSPAPSSSSPAYKCSSNTYYTTPTSSFTGYNIDQPNISIPSNDLLNSTCSSNASATAILQEGFVGPVHHYAPLKDSLFMFGGDQASCSSSDGSCSNQITHGKDLDYEHEQMGLQCYLYNGVDEESQTFMLSNGGNVNGYAEKQNGLYGDYGLDQIKQLISTNTCNNFNFNFSVDEIKTEEKVMYY